MARIDHVTVRSSDLDASLKLFTQVFELLEFTARRRDGAGFYEWNDFSVAQADGEHPATKNVHVGSPRPRATRSTTGGRASPAQATPTTERPARGRNTAPATTAPSSATTTTTRSRPSIMTRAAPAARSTTSGSASTTWM